MTWAEPSRSSPRAGQAAIRRGQAHLGEGLATVAHAVGVSRDFLRCVLERDGLDQPGLSPARYRIGPELVVGQHAGTLGYLTDQRPAVQRGQHLAPGSPAGGCCPGCRHARRQRARGPCPAADPAVVPPDWAGPRGIAGSHPGRGAAANRTGQGTAADRTAGGHRHCHAPAGVLPRGRRGILRRAPAGRGRRRDGRLPWYSGHHGAPGGVRRWACVRSDRAVPLGNSVSRCELGFCYTIGGVAGTISGWCCRCSTGW
jgi:hypothetical protein